MRKTRSQQLPLSEPTTDHHKAKEFAQISAILDSNDSIYSLVRQDLGISENNVGANGMTAEQVIRAAIIYKIGGYSSESLPFIWLIPVFTVTFARSVSVKHLRSHLYSGVSKCYPSRHGKISTR